MKFKVGDKVRVRKDLVYNCQYNGLTFYPWMKTEAKNVNRIIWTDNNNRCGIDTTSYTYDFSMFELVEEPVFLEKLVIYCENNKTIAKYYKGDKTVSAEAKCSLEDEFDFGTGAKLAMYRAIEKMKKEDEVDYSWVKCVGYRQNYEFYFTVDKVYKIYDDGRITNDNDFTYGGKDSYRNSKEKVMELLNLYYIFEEVQN